MSPKKHDSFPNRREPINFYSLCKVHLKEKLHFRMNNYLGPRLANFTMVSVVHMMQHHSRDPRTFRVSLGLVCTLYLTSAMEGAMEIAFKNEQTQKHTTLFNILPLSHSAGEQRRTVADRYARPRPFRIQNKRTAYRDRERKRVVVLDFSFIARLILLLMATPFP